MTSGFYHQFSVKLLDRTTPAKCRKVDDVQGFCADLLSTKHPLRAHLNPNKLAIKDIIAAINVTTLRTLKQRGKVWDQVGDGELLWLVTTSDWQLYDQRVLAFDNPMFRHGKRIPIRSPAALNQQKLLEFVRYFNPTPPPPSFPPAPLSPPAVSSSQPFQQHARREPPPPRRTEIGSKGISSGNKARSPTIPSSTPPPNLSAASSPPARLAHGSGRGVSGDEFRESVVSSTADPPASLTAHLLNTDATEKSVPLKPSKVADRKIWSESRANSQTPLAASPPTLSILDRGKQMMDFLDDGERKDNDNDGMERSNKGDANRFGEEISELKGFSGSKEGDNSGERGRVAYGHELEDAQDAVSETKTSSLAGDFPESNERLPSTAAVEALGEAELSRSRHTSPSSPFPSASPSPSLSRASSASLTVSSQSESARASALESAPASATASALLPPSPAHTPTAVPNNVLTSHCTPLSTQFGQPGALTQTESETESNDLDKGWGGELEPIIPDAQARTETPPSFDVRDSELTGGDNISPAMGFMDADLGVRSEAESRDDPIEPSSMYLSEDAGVSEQDSPYLPVTPGGKEQLLADGGLNESSGEEGWDKESLDKPKSGEEGDLFDGGAMPSSIGLLVEADAQYQEGARKAELSAAESRDEGLGVEGMSEVMSQEKIENEEKEEKEEREEKEEPEHADTEAEREARNEVERIFDDSIIASSSVECAENELADGLKDVHESEKENEGQSEKEVESERNENPYNGEGDQLDHTLCTVLPAGDELVPPTEQRQVERMETVDHQEDDEGLEYQGGENGVVEKSPQNNSNSTSSISDGDSDGSDANGLSFYPDPAPAATMSSLHPRPISPLPDTFHESSVDLDVVPVSASPQKVQESHISQASLEARQVEKVESKDLVTKIDVAVMDSASYADSDAHSPQQDGSSPSTESRLVQHPSRETERGPEGKEASKEEEREETREVRGDDIDNGLELGEGAEDEQEEDKERGEGEEGEEGGVLKDPNASKEAMERAVAQIGGEAESANHYPPDVAHDIANGMAAATLVPSRSQGMSAEQSTEVGPELKSLESYSPAGNDPSLEDSLPTGVGPVSASLIPELALEEISAADAKPSNTADAAPQGIELLSAKSEAVSCSLDSWTDQVEGEREVAQAADEGTGVEPEVELESRRGEDTDGQQGAEGVPCERDDESHSASIIIPVADATVLDGALDVRSASSSAQNDAAVGPSPAADAADAVDCATQSDADADVALLSVVNITEVRDLFENSKKEQETEQDTECGAGLDESTIFHGSKSHDEGRSQDPGLCSEHGSEVVDVEADAIQLSTESTIIPFGQHSIDDTQRREESCVESWEELGEQRSMEQVDTEGERTQSEEEHVTVDAIGDVGGAFSLEHGVELKDEECEDRETNQENELERAEEREQGKEQEGGQESAQGIEPERVQLIEQGKVEGSEQKRGQGREFGRECEREQESELELEQERVLAHRLQEQESELQEASRVRAALETRLEETRYLLQVFAGLKNGRRNDERQMEKETRRETGNVDVGVHSSGETEPSADRALGSEGARVRTGEEGKSVFFENTMVSEASVASVLSTSPKSESSAHPSRQIAQTRADLGEKQRERGLLLPTKFLGTIDALEESLMDVSVESIMQKSLPHSHSHTHSHSSSAGTTTPQRLPIRQFSRSLTTHTPANHPQSFSPSQHMTSPIRLVPGMLHPAYADFATSSHNSPASCIPDLNPASPSLESFSAGSGPGSGKGAAASSPFFRALCAAASPNPNSLSSSSSSPPNLTVWSRDRDSGDGHCGAVTAGGTDGGKGKVRGKGVYGMMDQDFLADIDQVVQSAAAAAAAAAAVPSTGSIRARNPASFFAAALAASIPIPNVAVSEGLPANATADANNKLSPASLNASTSIEKQRTVRDRSGTAGSDGVKGDLAPSSVFTALSVPSGVSSLSVMAAVAAVRATDPVSGGRSALRGDNDGDDDTDTTRGLLEVDSQSQLSRISAFSSANTSFVNSIVAGNNEDNNNKINSNNNNINNNSNNNRLLLPSERARAPTHLPGPSPTPTTTPLASSVSVAVAIAAESMAAQSRAVLSKKSSPIERLAARQSLIRAAKMMNRAKAEAESSIGFEASAGTYAGDYRNGIAAEYCEMGGGASDETREDGQASGSSGTTASPNTPATAAAAVAGDAGTGSGASAIIPVSAQSPFTASRSSLPMVALELPDLELELDDEDNDEDNDDDGPMEHLESAATGPDPDRVHKNSIGGVEHEAVVDTHPIPTVPTGLQGSDLARQTSMAKGSSLDYSTDEFEFTVTVTAFPPAFSSSIPPVPSDLPDRPHADAAAVPSSPGPSSVAATRNQMPLQDHSSHENALESAPDQQRIFAKTKSIQSGKHMKIDDSWASQEAGSSSSSSSNNERLTPPIARAAHEPNGRTIIHPQSSRSHISSDWNSESQYFGSGLIEVNSPSNTAETFDRRAPREESDVGSWDPTLGSGTMDAGEEQPSQRPDPDLSSVLSSFSTKYHDLLLQHQDSFGSGFFPVRDVRTRHSVLTRLSSSELQAEKQQSAIHFHRPQLGSIPGSNSHPSWSTSHAAVESTEESLLERTEGGGIGEGEGSSLSGRPAGVFYAPPNSPGSAYHPFSTSFSTSVSSFFPAADHPALSNGETLSADPSAHASAVPDAAGAKVEEQTQERKEVQEVTQQVAQEEKDDSLWRGADERLLERTPRTLLENGTEHESRKRGGEKGESDKVSDTAHRQSRESNPAGDRVDSAHNDERGGSGGDVTEVRKKGVSECDHADDYGDGYGEGHRDERGQAAAGLVRICSVEEQSVNDISTIGSESVVLLETRSSHTNEEPKPDAEPDAEPEAEPEADALVEVNSPSKKLLALPDATVASSFEMPVVAQYSEPILSPHSRISWNPDPKVAGQRAEREKRDGREAAEGAKSLQTLSHVAVPAQEQEQQQAPEPLKSDPLDPLLVYYRCFLCLTCPPPRPPSLSTAGREDSIQRASRETVAYLPRSHKIHLLLWAVFQLYGTSTSTSPSPSAAGSSAAASAANGGVLSTHIKMSHVARAFKDAGVGHVCAAQLDILFAKLQRLDLHSLSFRHSLTPHFPPSAPHTSSFSMKDSRELPGTSMGIGRGPLSGAGMRGTSNAGSRGLSKGNGGKGGNIQLSAAATFLEFLVIVGRVVESLCVPRDKQQVVLIALPPAHFYQRNHAPTNNRNINWNNNSSSSSSPSSPRTTTSSSRVVSGGGGKRGEGREGQQEDPLMYLNKLVGLPEDECGLGLGVSEGGVRSSSGVASGVSVSSELRALAWQRLEKKLRALLLTKQTSELPYAARREHREHADFYSLQLAESRRSVSGILLRSPYYPQPVHTPHRGYAGQGVGEGGERREQQGEEMQRNDRGDEETRNHEAMELESVRALWDANLDQISFVFAHYATPVGQATRTAIAGCCAVAGGVCGGGYTLNAPSLATSSAAAPPPRGLSISTTFDLMQDFTSRTRVYLPPQLLARRIPGWPAAAPAPLHHPLSFPFSPFAGLGLAPDSLHSHNITAAGPLPVSPPRSSSRGLSRTLSSNSMHSAGTAGTAGMGHGGRGVSGASEGSFRVLTFEACRDMMIDFQLLPQVVDVKTFLEEFRCCKLWEWRIGEQILLAATTTTSTTSPCCPPAADAAADRPAQARVAALDPSQEPQREQGRGSAGDSASVSSQLVDPYGFVACSRHNLCLSLCGFIELLTRLAASDAARLSTAGNGPGVSFGAGPVKSAGMQRSSMSSSAPTFFDKYGIEREDLCGKAYFSLRNLLYLMDASDGRQKLLKAARKRGAVTAAAVKTHFAFL